MPTPLAPTLRINVAAARDGAGLNLRPASLILRDGVILAVDRPEAIDHGDWGSVQRVIDKPRALLLPALVNAHAHLDLSHIPRQPFEGDFSTWLRGVVAQRPRDDQAIAAAVEHGLALSREAGVGWIGDIAGSVAAANARFQARDNSLPGASYLECFGIGQGQLDGYIALRQRLARVMTPSDSLTRLGISPHAPYSVGPALFTAIARLAQAEGFPLTTHLAETRDEVEFIRHGTGPLADMLRALGKFDPSITPQNLSPVEALTPALRLADWLVAHGNEASAADIRILAASRASMVYCPLASEYFGLPKDRPHPYRDMLAAGVNVCLGTDGLLCQPAGEPQPLGILPQMRRLYQRDGTDPQTMLRMATINGLTALGFPPHLATLTPGSPARFMLVDINPVNPADPLIQALRSDVTCLGIGYDLPQTGC